MKVSSFIRSLMEFNKRVLYQGTVYMNKSYKIKDLNDKLFFNEIFISNMQEMFQKYNVSEIMDDYIECIGIYCRNISEIIRQLMTIKSTIRIINDDSFERRLTMEKVLKDQIITKFCHAKPNTDYKFINGMIYYLSILSNGYVAISFVDPRLSAYNNVLKYDFNRYTMYWKSDDCIRDYIKSTYSSIGTIAIRVTTSNISNEITKIEYNGDTNFMKQIVWLFPENALIISNPYIYTGDIRHIIINHLDEIPQVTKPNFESINIQNLFKNDILIEYPNDSFDEYLQLLSLSSKHPEVKSIYITIYRIGEDPSIFYILRDAVLNGIDVHVNIELYASGEEINKMWMREMIAAGIYVTTYAIGELKVHCKLTLISFTNGNSIAQVGTGNYHTKTSTQYTDFSLITSDRMICNQVKNVFKMLSGVENVSFNSDLLVTRFNARKELIKLIDIESKKGEEGCIVIKCNALDDEEISNHLNIAADHGCIINLIIRGVCTWIPNQLRSNVTIKSIVWDKLEHSRVFCFGKTNPTIYIGSLDLVTKKLDQRIETLVRIKDPDIGIIICNYLNRYITNIDGSWILTNSGMYIKE